MGRDEAVHHTGVRCILHPEWNLDLLDLGCGSGNDLCWSQGGRTAGEISRESYQMRCDADLYGL